MLIEQMPRTDDLTATGRQIAEVILAYPQYVIDLPLKELAAQAYVSEASVIRFVQKLGCKGFTDFKIRLARELDTFTGEKPAVPVDVPIASGADTQGVCAAMFNLSMQALTESHDRIDVNLITRAANLMHRSALVRIYGRGESLILAEDFHYKLLRVGIRSALNAQNGFQEAGSVDGEQRCRIRECAGGLRVL